MRKSLVIIIVLLVAIAAGGYYYGVYPPALFKRATQHALDDFSKAVASKNAATIENSLKMLLSDSATLRLEIALPSLGANTSQPMTQDFDKAGFIAFVGNTLYSLNDYSYVAKVRDFNLSVDKKTAEITFTSQEEADGMSYYGGMGVNMHFSSDTACTGQVHFEQKQALLDKAVCRMQLHSSPKS